MSQFVDKSEQTVQPETLEERVIWHCIVWTYGYYVLGALYVLAPVVGWTLAMCIARRDGLSGLPTVVWVWVAGMLAMLLALIVAYADFQLGLGPMLKSSVGWAKGWALLAVFLVVGFGRVRLVVLARAASILGIQTLCVLPLVAMAWALGLPEQLYVSPVSVVGGPGPEYFAVELYSISPDSGTPRWRLFAPWAPAIGLVMCVYFMLVMAETNRVLRWSGMAGILLAIVASSSRLGLLAIPVTLGVVWLLLNCTRPAVLLAAAPITFVAGVLAEPLMNLQEEAMGRFHGARADSSRVRAALGRIAVERWQNEAVTWGHGAVERGPHLVEFMPIGTHHSWFGLLFVKGLVGVLGLAIPMLWSLAVLVPHAHRSDTGHVALRMLVLLFLYTFAENLEILVYLYWPAMVVMGMAFREASGHPITMERKLG